MLVTVITRSNHLESGNGLKKKPAGADLGGGRGGRGPPFQLVIYIFFLSKYTIILSFWKQAVGIFDFF